MADRVDPDAALREELVLLRAVVARRLREQLEDPARSASPAMLEAARKFLESQLRPAPAVKAPAISLNLPFNDAE